MGAYRLRALMMAHMTIASAAHKIYPHSLRIRENFLAFCG